MKKLFIIPVCIYLLTACSKQEREEPFQLSCIQIIDRKGLAETISSKPRLDKFQNTDFSSPQPYQQVLRVYAKNKENKNLSMITTYHPNGQLWQYLEVLDGRAHGQFKEWFVNGQLRIEARVIGGPADLSVASKKQWLFDKTCIVWDENGLKLSQMQYENGLLEGDSFYYYPTGELKKTIPYHQGKIQGKMIEYYPSHNISFCAEYENDLSHGQKIKYDQDQHLLYRETYSFGLLHEAKYYSLKQSLIAEIHKGYGHQAHYSQQGNVIQLSEFQKGRLEGAVQIFSEKGELLKEYHVKNAKKHGEEIEYFSKEELSFDLTFSSKKYYPKISLYWDEDMIHGIVKTWYDNGQLESQKETAKNKKSGTSCSWYRDGHLMLIEEYENDVLLKGSYYKPNHPEPISTIFDGNGIATLYNSDGTFLRKVRYQKGFPLEE